MQVRKMKRPLAVVATALLGTVLTVSVADARVGEGRGGSKDPAACAPATERNRSEDRSLKAVGLTPEGKLVCFSERGVRRPGTIGVVSGLVTDTSLVGIDYRPANGSLVGLGNAGGVYVIDPATAAAVLLSRLDVALSGTSFGIDFNPTVDRLRVVSDTGQNLRANVDTGVTLVDLPLAGGTASAAAYTNNDADPATATTLYDVTLTDQVAIQAPPNNGNLNPIGALGVDAGPAAGFDIHSTIRNGTTTDVRGLAVLTVGSSSGLYGINLFTGKASLIGTFPLPVVDLAIPLNQL